MMTNSQTDSLEKKVKEWLKSNLLLVFLTLIFVGVGTFIGWCIWRSSFPAPTSPEYQKKIQACMVQHPMSQYKTYSQNQTHYVDKNDVDILKHNICETFVVVYEQASGKDYALNNIILIFSVIAGIFLALVDPGKPIGGRTAAFIGALTTALVGIRSLIPISQGADFYRYLAAEGNVLLNKLSFGSVSSSDYQQVLESYNKLLLEASQNPSSLSSNSSPSPSLSPTSSPSLSSSPTSSQKP